MRAWQLAGRHDRVAVVVARPGDDAFGCGSLIALAARAGARVTVLCATFGDDVERRPDPVTDAWPLGLLREAELCQAAMVLGADEVEFLDHVRLPRSGSAVLDSRGATPVRELAGQLAARLERVDPDVVITLEPTDGRPDQRHLRDALDRALPQLARPVRLVLSHPGGRVSGDDRHDSGLTVLDTSLVAGIRERAIACYLSIPSPFEDLPAAVRTHLLSCDVVGEVAVGPSSPAPTPAR